MFLTLRLYEILIPGRFGRCFHRHFARRAAGRGAALLCWQAFRRFLKAQLATQRALEHFLAALLYMLCAL